MKVQNDGRSTVNNCFLKIIHIDFASEPLITLNPGKWDADNEPMSLNTKLNIPFFDTAFLHQIGGVSITAQSSETFCFVIKFEND